MNEFFITGFRLLVCSKKAFNGTIVSFIFYWYNFRHEYKVEYKKYGGHHET